MNANPQSGGKQKTGRLGVGLTGVLLVLFALAADQLSPGGSGGFGRGQLLIAMAGAALIAGSLAGRRIVPLYKGLALLLLNTLVVLVVVEIAATAVLRLLGSGPPAGDAATRYRQRIEQVSYYADQPWAAEFWAEHWRAEQQQIYQPWVLWRIAPHTGRHVNVSAIGLRHTPGAVCTPGARRIFVFGGSAVWGWGAPDDGTIPAHLQAALDAAGHSTCVTNFGQNGFVSTQDVLELQRAIAAGNVPDVAIFYHGYNDISSAALQGRAGAHLYYDRIARRLETEAPAPAREPGWSAALRATRTWALIERASTRASRPDPAAAGPQPTPPPDAPGVQGLADSVLQVYHANVRTIAALAGQYGFDWHVFWQPVLPVSGKPRTAEEEGMGSSLGPILPLARAVFAGLAAAPPADPRFHDLRAVFDRDSTAIYIDFVHLTPPANRTVALRILEAMAGGRAGTPGTASTAPPGRSKLGEAPAGLAESMAVRAYPRAPATRLTTAELRPARPVVEPFRLAAQRAP